MRGRLFALLLAVSAGLSLLAPPAGAEPIFMPGQRIGLEPQAGLVVSKRLAGFEDADRKVVFAVLDLPPGAYEALERSAFGQDPPGVTVIKRESFPFASGIGFLITGKATASGVTLHKWFLLATAFGGVKDLSVMINVEVPEEARAVYTDEVVRKVLTSVTFRPAPVQEQIGLLPFKLGEMSGFRVMQAMPGSGVIITDGQTDDINKQPYMIISVGPGGPSEPTERGKFAREMLSSAPLRELNVTVADAMRIGGSPGFEIRAQAKGMDGLPVSLVQWVRFGSGGFLRIIGVSRQEDWDALFTRFRAVRDGIEMK